jgi:hypothetical protein
MVVRIIPETLEQLKFLRDWQSTNAIDFWILPDALKQFADIHINSETYYKNFTITQWRFSTEKKILVCAFLLNYIFGT